MTGSVNLQRLLDELLSVPVGSRDLDADIYEAVGFRVKRTPEHRVIGKVGRTWAYLAAGRWVAMGNVTTDLTDTVRLCRSLLPKAHWTVSNVAESDHARAFAELVPNPAYANFGHVLLGRTPELALCGCMVSAMIFGCRAEAVA